MNLALALAATLLSSCALNVGYLLEHEAVGQMPPLSIKSPLTSLRHLLGSRRWLIGFAIEGCGWALFVLALSLAPLSLVQATAAGGIGILAVLVSRVTHEPLSKHEWLGVATAIAGLVLLGISLAGGHGEGGGASYLTVGLWIGASAVAAFVSVRLLSGRIGAAAAYGVDAAGLLFAAGDISTKAAVEAADSHLAFIAALICAYAFGTLVLQAGFQRGSALTTAGIATLLTNALPIVAGMTIFGEPLPHGWLGAVRIAAFSCVVVGAVFLGERRRPSGPGEAVRARPAGPRPRRNPLPGPRATARPESAASTAGSATWPFQTSRASSAAVLTLPSISSTRVPRVPPARRSAPRRCGARRAQRPARAEDQHRTERVQEEHPDEVQAGRRRDDAAVLDRIAVSPMSNGKSIHRSRGGTRCTRRRSRRRARDRPRARQPVLRRRRSARGRAPRRRPRSLRSADERAPPCA